MGDDYDAPPPPPPLRRPNRLLFSTLPDIVHTTIASYLTSNDLQAVMESSSSGPSWAYYGGRTKEVELLVDRELKDSEKGPSRSTIVSIMRRRNGLVTRLTASASAVVVDEVVTAMREGYLNNLAALELHPLEPDMQGQALCSALADGLCPNITKLVVPYSTTLLGEVLRSRVNQEGCGLLKSLEFAVDVSREWPLLSSDICQALEELKVKDINYYCYYTIPERMSRAMASHLKILCSSGVAPNLQVLDLDGVDDTSPLSGGPCWRSMATPDPSEAIRADGE